MNSPKEKTLGKKTPSKNQLPFGVQGDSEVICIPDIKNEVKILKICIMKHLFLFDFIKSQTYGM